MIPIPTPAPPNLRIFLRESAPFRQTEQVIDVEGFIDGVLGRLLIGVQRRRSSLRNRRAILWRLLIEFGESPWDRSYIFRGIRRPS